MSELFIERTPTALGELMGRRLDDVRLAVMMLDGMEIAERTHVVALGITTEGVKIPLGLWEGSTENATLARTLLADLVDRGLDPEQAILFVIDGGKALRRAIKDVFGEHALVHRCHRHKERNVCDLLPERDRPAILARIRGAWALKDASLAEQRLELLASELERTWPDAAGSLREGLEDTLTLMRLGIGGQLAKTLCSTNPCESMIEIVRYTQRNVKRWQDGDMRKRWTAAGMLVAEQQFRRIIGYRDLAKLVIAIERHADRVKLDPGPASLTLTGRRSRYCLTVNPWRPPPKFHDDPDILAAVALAANGRAVVVWHGGTATPGQHSGDAGRGLERPDHHRRHQRRRPGPDHRDRRIRQRDRRPVRGHFHDRSRPYLHRQPAGRRHLDTSEDAGSSRQQHDPPGSQRHRISDHHMVRR